MPLASALRVASLTNVVQVLATLLCAVVIDKVGRRSWTLTSFVVSGVALCGLWMTGSASAAAVGGLGSFAYGVIGSTNTLLYLYTPEIYPTRMRAIATAIATCWLRAASAAGPAMLGFVVEGGGLNTVFMVFAGVCAIGAVASAFMIETRGRRLEEIAV
jgi:MFS transporter, putative metabolite:H+ symporter